MYVQIEISAFELIPLFKLCTCLVVRPALGWNCCHQHQCVVSARDVKSFTEEDLFVREVIKTSILCACLQTLLLHHNKTYTQNTNKKNSIILVCLPEETLSHVTPTCVWSTWRVFVVIGYPLPAGPLRLVFPFRNSNNWIYSSSLYAFGCILRKGKHRAPISLYGWVVIYLYPCRYVFCKYLYELSAPTIQNKWTLCSMP